MKIIKLLLSERGGTFIELLVATAIISLTLTTVILAYLSSQEAVVSSWDRTDETLCASYILEEIKSIPAEHLLTVYKENKRGDQKAIGLHPSHFSITIDKKYSSYSITIDLEPYQANAFEQGTELLKVKVRVQKGDSPPVKKASLIRTGVSPS